MTHPRYGWRRVNTGLFGMLLVTLCSLVILPGFSFAGDAELVGVWRVVGCDRQLGKYHGKLEIKRGASGLTFTRMIEPLEAYPGLDRKLNLVWTGRVNRETATPQFELSLHRAHFISQLGALSRTAEDAQPLHVTGVVRRFFTRWLKINYRAKQDAAFSAEEYAVRIGPPAEPLWQTQYSLYATHENPQQPFIPPDPIFAGRVESIFGTPILDKATLFQFFADYHQLPSVSPYLTRPEFQQSVHYQAIDHTDFAFYRRHPRHLRVVNKVVDPISLAEEHLRADAFSSGLAKKMVYYQRQLDHGGLVPAHGMLVKYVDADGQVADDINSALWTGVYIHTQALRYKHEGDAQALNNIRHSVQGLMTLMDITGDPHTFARTLRHTGPPLTENWRRGEAVFSHLDWLDGGNNDMAKGLALGLVAAWNALPVDDPLKPAIAAHAVALLELEVFQVDANASFPSVNPAIAALLAGLTSRNEDLISQGLAWLRTPPMVYLAQQGAGVFYIFGFSDWSANHLASITVLIMQQLLAMTDDVALQALWKDTPQTIWRTLQKVEQPLQAVLALTTGDLADPQQQRMASRQALWGLRSFPLPKRAHSIDYRIRGDFVVSPFPSLPWQRDWLTNVRRLQGITAATLLAHRWDEYVWNDQHFAVSYSGLPAGINLPGADYLFLYWTAVDAGLVTHTLN